MQGVRAYFNVDNEGLYTLGTVVVDYRGYRVTAQSIIPGTKGIIIFVPHETQFERKESKHYQSCLLKMYIYLGYRTKAPG